MMDDENEQCAERREYTRPYPRAYTRETMRGDRRHRHHTEKESQPHVLGVQIIVCILALLVVVILHVAKSPMDKTVRQTLTNALSSKFDQKAFSNQVSSVLKRFDIAVPNVKGVFQTSPRSNTSKAKASSDTRTGLSSAPAASNGAAASATSLQGKGGADLIAQTSNGLLVPPASVSLGPYLLSAQPVWPVQGRITSPFGFRVNPVTHQHSFHTGLDIAAPKDTPILPALPGVIEQAGQSVDYGNYLLLNHGGGVETFYGHCDQLLVEQGASVKIGEEIAKVGTTGLSTGYHLHFEIHVDGVAVNPARVLDSKV